MSAKGLDCNWRSGWWRKRRNEKLVLAIVLGCVLVALVVGASVAGSILAGAGGLACCVPLADGFGGTSE